ncbi:hypothetical protein ACROYT_G028219 [Oculina patagonica]
MGNLFGRQRVAKGYDQTFYVTYINGCTLGRLIINKCGNAGNWSSLNYEKAMTLRFLQAAITFVPDASNDGADLSNASFILNVPRSAFVVKAGDGDWEFYFTEDNYGNITGKCTRQPFRHYLWNGVKKAFTCVGKLVWKAVKTVVPLAITAGAAAIPGVGTAMASVFGALGGVGMLALTED